MAYIWFEIDKYFLTLGESLQFRQTIDVEAQILCTAKNGQSAYFYFFQEGAWLPKPYLDINLKRGFIFLHISKMPLYLQILRDEKPLFLHMDGTQPTRWRMSTHFEPPGEKESN